MKCTSSLIGLASIVVVAACTQPADREEETAATEAAATDSAVADVARVRDSWMTAWQAADAAALAALYEPEGVDMQNHQPTLLGADAFRNSMASQFASATPTNIALTPEKTVVSGDLAYDRGLYSVTMQPKAGGQPVIDSGRYLVVLRKQADGSWKIVEGMANSPTPLTTNQ